MRCHTLVRATIRQTIRRCRHAASLLGDARRPTFISTMSRSRSAPLLAMRAYKAAIHTEMRVVINHASHRHARYTQVRVVREVARER